MEARRSAGGKAGGKSDGTGGSGRVWALGLAALLAGAAWLGPGVAIAEHSEAVVPATEGPLNRWDAEGDVLDRAGNAAEGSLANGAGFGEGRCGQGFHLDGLDDFVQVPDHPAWAFGNADFSIDLFVRFDADQAGRFIGHDEGPHEFNKWFFAYRIGSGLGFHLNAPNDVMPQGGYWLGVVPFQPVVGAWYHLAMVRSGDTWTIFVDGQAGPSDTLAVAVQDAAAPLTIGQAEGGGHHRGGLDQLRIWDRALSREEVAALGNCAPVGSIAPVPPQECERGGATVTLDGSASHDPDGDSLTFAWSAPGIAFDDPSSPTPTARFPLEVTRVTLVVSDGQGSATARADVVVQDTLAPTVAITRPAPGSIYVDDLGLEVVHGLATVPVVDLAVPILAVGGLRVRADAQDQCGVASVRFEALASPPEEVLAAPYTYFVNPPLATVDPPGLAPLEQRVTATVTDLGGFASSAEVGFLHVATAAPAALGVSAYTHRVSVEDIAGNVATNGDWVTLMGVQLPPLFTPPPWAQIPGLVSDL